MVDAGSFLVLPAYLIPTVFTMIVSLKFSISPKSIQQISFNLLSTMSDSTAAAASHVNRVRFFATHRPSAPPSLVMTAISTFSWDVKTDCKVKEFPKAGACCSQWICYLPFLEHKIGGGCLENSLMTLCYYSFKMV